MCSLTIFFIILNRKTLIKDHDKREDEEKMTTNEPTEEDH